jgi:hypothetical protein
MADVSDRISKLGGWISKLPNIVFIILPNALGGVSFVTKGHVSLAPEWLRIFVVGMSVLK